MLRRQGVYRAAAVLAALTVTSLGASLAGATLRGPAATLAPPGKEPFPCNPERDQVKSGSGAPGVSLCGSPYNDTLTSKFGTTIRAYQGADVIKAKNGKADEIWGGPGTDTAFVDAKDTVRGDVDKCPPQPRCPRASAGLRFARSQVEFFKEEPIIVCDLEPGTENRRMWLALEPRIRAADSTRRVDWQTVAYTPVLYRHDGTDWRVYQQKMWLFDRTFDPSETATAFNGNFWRHLRTKQRTFLFFYADDPGTYRVSVKYYWYRTASVASREEEDWVDDHFGEFETNNRHESCTFPG